MEFLDMVKNLQEKQSGKLVLVALYLFKGIENHELLFYKMQSYI